MRGARAGWLGLALAGCAAGPPPPRPLAGEFRTTWDIATRVGAGGAEDVADQRLRNHLDLTLSDPALGGVRAALTVRDEDDLDGASAGDPFGDLADTRPDSRLTEVVRGYVEAHALLDGTAALRAGRQSVWAADHGWRLDGGRLDLRAPGMEATVFGGQRASAFSAPDRPTVAGGWIAGRPQPETWLRLTLVHHLADRAMAEATHAVVPGLTARVGLSLFDHRPDRETAAASWRRGPVEVELRYRRKSSRPHETPPFDDTDRVPGARPPTDTEHLHLDGLHPFHEGGGEAAVEVWPGLELEAECWRREVLDGGRRDATNWTGWTVGAGVEWRDPFGFGLDATVRWRRRDANRARIPAVPAAFLDTRGEGEESSDELLGDVRWRRGGFEGTATLGWRRLDYVSRFRRLRNVDGFFVGATIAWRFPGGVYVRAGYGYEEDYGLLDESTAGLHLGRAEVGWRF